MIEAYNEIMESAAASRDADLVAKEIAIYHGNPSGASKSSRVRVTVFLERYS